MLNSRHRYEEKQSPLGEQQTINMTIREGPNERSYLKKKFDGMLDKHLLAMRYRKSH